jgi:hypothetical protein
MHGNRRVRRLSYPTESRRGSNAHASAVCAAVVRARPAIARRVLWSRLWGCAKSICGKGGRLHAVPAVNTGTRGYGNRPLGDGIGIGFWPDWQRGLTSGCGLMVVRIIRGVLPALGGGTFVAFPSPLHREIKKSQTIPSLRDRCGSGHL